MNSEAQMKQFLVTMGELFPGGMSTVKAQAYYNLLKEDLLGVNLKDLLEKLANSSKYFPTILDIKDTLGIKKQTRRELATEFIDTMLSVMAMSVNIYEHAGADNCRFWQECTGMTAGSAKQDMQSGRLATQYLRTQWIDNAERAYLKHDEEKKLKAAESIARLTGDT